jgi:hypothetical protein
VPQDHADRAAGDLGGDVGALGARPVHPGHQPAPARRVGRPVGQEEPHRAAGLTRQPGHPGEFVGLALEIAVHAEGTAPDRAERPADAHQFRLLGLVAGDQLAGRGLVRIGARGGEAERAGLDRRRSQPVHRGDVLGGRGLAVDAALAHHIDAQRMVRQLRGYVDGARQAVERVEELGKALPRPVEPFVERGAGNVLDRLHQVDQVAAVLAPHRGEADAAIAEQDRRHAVPGRRRQDRVPGCLAVVMGVDIDPAGGDEEPVGGELAPRRPGLAADRGDDPAVDRDIAAEARPPGAVEDGAAADDDVVHRMLLPIARNEHAAAPGPAQPLRPHGAMRCAVTRAVPLSPGQQGRRRCRQASEPRSSPAPPAASDVPSSRGCSAPGTASRRWTRPPTGLPR